MADKQIVDARGLSTAGIDDQKSTGSFPFRKML